MKKSNAEGFTLFEVVVALAIAAIGLGLLMSAAGMGLGNSGLASQYVEATRRAQSHLAALGVMLPLMPGERSGDDGGGFSWRTRISQTYAGRAPPGIRLPALYDVEVSIAWRTGNSTKTVSLKSQRIGAP